MSLSQRVRAFPERQVDHLHLGEIQSAVSSVGFISAPIYLRCDRRHFDQFDWLCSTKTYGRCRYSRLCGKDNQARLAAPLNWREIE